MMNNNDFPMGRGFPRQHPKRLRLTRLIGENAPEYARAPQSSGFRSAEHGRFIRSRTDIITAVISELMPSEEEGRYMIREDGVWGVRVGIDSGATEVRFMIQERFNKLIRTWNGELHPLPPLQPDQDDDEVDPSAQKPPEEREDPEEQLGEVVVDDEVDHVVTPQPPEEGDKVDHAASLHPIHDRQETKIYRHLEEDHECGEVDAAKAEEASLGSAKVSVSSQDLDVSQATADFVLNLVGEGSNQASNGQQSEVALALGVTVLPRASRPATNGDNLKIRIIPDLATINENGTFPKSEGAKHLIQALGRHFRVSYMRK